MGPLTPLDIMGPLAHKIMMGPLAPLDNAIVFLLSKLCSKLFEYLLNPLELTLKIELCAISNFY